MVSGSLKLSKIFLESVKDENCVVILLEIALDVEIL